MAHILSAPRCDRLISLSVFDELINSDYFRAYVAQQPMPLFKSGDILVRFIQPTECQNYFTNSG
jgi:hypothetical protein